MRKCEFCEELAFVKEVQSKDGIKYRYTSAFVDEIIRNGESFGRTTHYTWLPLNYCPSCGKKIR